MVYTGLTWDEYMERLETPLPFEAANRECVTRLARSKRGIVQTYEFCSEGMGSVGSAS